VDERDAAQQSYEEATRALLDYKLSLTGGTMSGPINMGGQSITNMSSLSIFAPGSDNDKILIGKRPGTSYIILLPGNAPAANTFLKYDGTDYAWATAAGTLTAFTGASSGAAGTLGGVPAPQAGDQAKYLQGDGTWSAVSGGTAATNFMFASLEVDVAVSAGAAIPFPNVVVYNGITASPDGKTFSMPGGCTYRFTASIGRVYSGGAGYQWRINGTTDIGELGAVSSMLAPLVGSIAVAYYTATSTITASLVAKSNVGIERGYDVYSMQGSYITIESITNTNGITAFTGATSGAPGTIGYIPAPQAGDQVKFLSGSGNWASAGSALTAFTEATSGVNGTQGGLPCATNRRPN
jgi:hypothetical protein